MQGEIILPPIKTFTIEDSVKDQARKVLEEAAELFAEVNEYAACQKICNDASFGWSYRENAILEAMDTIQAVCNLLEMLDVWNDDIVEAYEAVVRKNQLRGRYEG